MATTPGQGARHSALRTSCSRNQWKKPYRFAWRVIAFNYTAGNSQWRLDVHARSVQDWKDPIGLPVYESFRCCCKWPSPCLWPSPITCAKCRLTGAHSPRGWMVGVNSAPTSESVPSLLNHSFVFYWIALRCSRHGSLIYEVNILVYAHASRVYACPFHTCRLRPYYFTIYSVTSQEMQDC